MFPAWARGTILGAVLTGLMALAGYQCAAYDALVARVNEVERSQVGHATHLVHLSRRMDRLGAVLLGRVPQPKGSDFE